MSSFAVVPKVRISLRAPGRGSVEVDGVPMSHVSAVSFRAEAGKLTEVTLTFPAEVELAADEATVVMDYQARKEEPVPDAAPRIPGLSTVG